MLIAFDCDGVLVDSEVIAADVDSRLLTEFGYEITPEEVTRRFAGLTSRAIHDLVEAELGRKLPDDFLTRQREELDRQIAADLKAVPGVDEMLDEVDGPRCVCSNSSDARLRLSLEKTNLWDRFRPYIFSAVEVGDKMPKPSPNVYLHAAKAFEIESREMLVVEDSVFGVTSAKMAGARVIGFTGGRHSWPGHADMLTDAGAETVIHRWTDFAKIADALMAWEGIPN